ncbi:hypothetical protein LDC_1970, partial [sediment metagenome]
MSRAMRSASSSVCTSPFDPGSTGTPEARASSRAEALSPIFSMALTDGPMKAMSRLRQ